MYSPAFYANINLHSESVVYYNIYINLNCFQINNIDTKRYNGYFYFNLELVVSFS